MRIEAVSFASSVMRVISRAVAVPARFFRRSSCEGPARSSVSGLTGAVFFAAGPSTQAASRRRATVCLTVLVPALLLGLFAAPPAALVQTIETLVSNIGKDTDGSLNSAFDFSQRFTTGGNSEGYRLTSVDVEFQVNSAVNQPTFVMQIWSDSADGTPDNLVATLSKPDSLVSGRNNFGASGEGALLSANTTYHVLYDVSAANNSNSVRPRITNSDGEDSGAAPGWSIANNSIIRNAGSGTWTDAPQSRKVALFGYAIVTTPTLSSATMEGGTATLTLTYNKTLDTASVPGADSFTVKVDGSEVPLALTDSAAVAGSTVTLRLAAAVSSGVTVTVSYVVPSSNPIQDADGNEAAALTDVSVTVADTTAPSLDTASVDGTALTLTYDEALDDASMPAASAFTVTVDGTASTPSLVSVTGAAVVLTLAEAVVSAGQTVTVSYVVPSANPVQDAVGNAAAALTDQAVSVLDTTAPVLSSATVDGTVLTLNYNERLDTNSVPSSSSFEVRVNNAIVGLAATDPVSVNGSMVVLKMPLRVPFGATVWLGYYTVQATNPIRDVARNAAVGFRGLTITAMDTTAPSLESASVDGTALTLTYDEALDTGSTPTASDFVVTVDGTAANLAATGPVSVSGSKVVLTLAEAVVSAGQTVTMSYTVPTTNPIRDLAENAAPALTDLAVTVEDETAPVLSTALVNGTTLTLTFDEKLDTNSVPVGNAFFVTVDGMTTNPSEVVITGSKVLLTLAAAVEISQTVKVGYSVPGNNRIKDLADNEAVGFGDQVVTVEDETVPVLSTALVNGTTLTLTYDKTLDTASKPAASAFTVTVDGTASNPSSVSVTGSTVVLTLAVAVESAGQTVTVSYAVPSTNPIRDAAENEAVGFSDQVVTVSDATSPVLSSTTASGTTLTLTYDERLDTGSTPVVSAFTVSVDGTASNPSLVSVTGSTVVLTLAAAVESASQTVTVSYTAPSANPIQDLADNAAGSFTNRAVGVADSTPPVLSTASVDGAALTLTWSEALDTRLTPAVSAFEVRVDGTASNPSLVSITGSTVVLTLAAAVESAGQTVTVSYTVPSANPIRDAAENEAAGFSGQVVTVVETTSPVLSSATVDGTTLTLTYDERLDTGSTPAVSAFTVSVDGTAANPSSVSVIGRTVVLTLATAVESAGRTVTVSYTVPSANPVQDLARPANTAAALSDWSVVVVETTVPSLSTASVDGTALTLTWSEALDDASTPAASAFAVTVDGTASSPSLVSITGATIVLTLAAAVESAGQTVTVSYTVPSATPVQDLADNAAAGFSDRSVVVVETTAPSLSTASVVGTALTLTYDERLDTASTPDASTYTVTVDGSVANLSAVTVTGATVVLTLATAVESAGQTVTVAYTVPSANPVQDLASPANAAAALSDRSVAVVETTGPILSTASVDGTALTLIWSEALDDTSTPAASAFSVTVDGTASNPTSVSVTGSTVVLTLATAVVSAGQSVTASYTVPSANPLQDMVANEAVGFSDREVTVVDTTAPVLSAASVDGIALTLTYDERLNTASTPVVSSYTVTVDGTVSNPSSVSVSGRTVVLTLAAAVENADRTVTVSYTVPSTNPVRDLADNAAAALSDRSVAVVETTGPVLTAASVAGTALTLTYDERLNTASTPVVSSYTVTVDGTVSNPASVSITGSTVVLTLATAVVSAGQAVTVSYTVPSAGPVEDLVDNAATGFIDREVTVVETTTPVLSAASVAGTALTLTYDERLDTASTPASTAFTVTVDGTASNPTSVSISGVTVLLTLAATAESTDQSVTVSYTVPATNPVQDLADPANAAADLLNQPVVIVETTGPVLSTATVAGTTLTLNWSEAVDPASTPALTAWTVTVDGTSTNPSSVSVTGSTVVLILATAVASAGQTVTVSYTVPSTNPIRDLADNVAAGFSDREVTVVDTMGPILSAANMAGTALTLTYDEKLDPASTPASTAFTVTVDGTASNPTSVSISGATLRLTLAATVQSADQTVTVSYTVPATNPVQDLADPANIAADLFNQPVVVAETSTPRLTGATVDGTELTLTYDGALDPASTPAATAYTVTVDGTVANPAAVSVSGSTVVLTLAESVASGHSVTVSYAVPAVNPIRDLSGNAAAAFSGRTVTNEALSSEAALSALALTDRFGTALPLNPTFSSETADYTVTVGGGVTSARVTATANHEAARLSGSLKKAGGAASMVVMTSRMAATLPELAVGDNVLTITVTAEDGTTRAYTLSITVAVTAVTAMRRETLKMVLAETGRQTLLSARDNVGARLGDVTPGLTLAGRAVGGPVSGLSVLPCRGDTFARPDDCDHGGRGMSASELFGSSAFSLTLNAADGEAAGSASPRWSLWGSGNLGSFEGRPDGMRYDGGTRALWLGADARAGSWVAGLAVSRGESEVDYGFDAGGETGSGRLETDLTALYPYGRWSIAEGTELRGFVGAGTGEARHRSGSAQAGEKAGLSMWMASTGLRKALPSVSGVSLVTQGDLSWVRMKTGGGAAVIGSLEADGWRMRVGLEAFRRFALSGGSSLEPFVEAAGRRDGGDGLTGTGLEVAGGVRYGAARLHLEARGRWLAAHTEDGVREHGLSVTARWSPDAWGRGLSFVLTPRWGASTGNSQALWGDELPLVAGSAAEASMDAALGYGITAGPDALLTPFVAFGVASGSENRFLRLGARYEALRALALEVSGERYESDAAEADQALRLDLNLRF